LYAVDGSGTNDPIDVDAVRAERGSDRRVGLAKSLNGRATVGLIEQRLQHRRSADAKKPAAALFSLTLR
jgi:hypothetical protein